MEGSAFLAPSRPSLAQSMTQLTERVPRDARCGWRSCGVKWSSLGDAGGAGGPFVKVAGWSGLAVPDVAAEDRADETRFCIRNDY